MKISLITITYNSEKTLADTIQSVLSQKYSDMEYIIVDGASKDKTVSIIKQYEPQFDGRMRWISEKDKGLYDAMSKGIRMTTGDVVGILNSDDFFTSKDVLEKISEAFTSPKPDDRAGKKLNKNNDKILKRKKAKKTKKKAQNKKKHR